MQRVAGHVQSTRKPLLFLPMLALVAGCATAVTEQPIALDAAEFVIMAGDSVVATERTTRTLDRLHGEIRLTGQARASYVAELSAPGTVQTLSADIAAWQGAGVETLRVELGSDSLVVESSRWNNVRQAFRPGAAAVYLHPSPALLEILLRRALVTGEAEPQVRVWLANQNTPAIASFREVDGRVRIDMAGTTVYVTHENGTLLMGEVPALGWVFHRR
jgi:hypothetical protein